MNDNRLDARMRALFAGIDTSTEFEARVLARIGTLHAGPDANLLACAQRKNHIIAIVANHFRSLVPPVSVDMKRFHALQILSWSKMSFCHNC